LPQELTRCPYCETFLSLTFWTQVESKYISSVFGMVSLGKLFSPV
jgi:hypothetical protein